MKLQLVNPNAKPTPGVIGSTHLDHILGPWIIRTRQVFDTMADCLHTGVVPDLAALQAALIANATAGLQAEKLLMDARRRRAA